MALAVAEPFRKLLDQGAVHLIAGRVELAVAGDDGVKIILRERGSGRLIDSDASWVINCTGPLPSNSVASNPVIGSLLVSGELRPDDLLLGIDTTIDGNAIAVDGKKVADLFVVGTLRKSMDWESTAVPELRNQAAATAERVLDLFGALRNRLWHGLHPLWHGLLTVPPPLWHGLLTVPRGPDRRSPEPRGDRRPSVWFVVARSGDRATAVEARPWFVGAAQAKIDLTRF